MGTAPRMVRQVRKSDKPEVQQALDTILEAIMWERLTLGDGASLLDAALSGPDEISNRTPNATGNTAERELAMNVTKALFRIRSAEFGICESLSEDDEKELIKILQDAGLHPVF